MKKFATIIIFSLLILAPATSCSIITNDRTQIQDGMHENYEPSSTARLRNSYNYSSDQTAIQQVYGNPTRFTILFGEDRRLETWYFDTSGYTAVFMNGTKVSEKSQEPEYREELYATIYTPDLFYTGMGIDEIVLATDQDDFLLSSLESESWQGRLMHMEGLSIGFSEGEINFVETYPAMTEIRLQAADFRPSASLTPEETANAGEHEFLVVMYLNDEFVDSYNSEIAIEFSGENVCLTENGERFCLRRSGENEYTNKVEKIKMFMILDGFIWHTEGENGLVETLFSRVDD